VLALWPRLQIPPLRGISECHPSGNTTKADHLHALRRHAALATPSSGLLLVGADALISWRRRRCLTEAVREALGGPIEYCYCMCALYGHRTLASTVCAMSKCEPGRVTRTCNGVVVTCVCVSISVAFVPAPANRDMSPDHAHRARVYVTFIAYASCVFPPHSRSAHTPRATPLDEIHVPSVCPTHMAPPLNRRGGRLVRKLGVVARPAEERKRSADHAYPAVVIRSRTAIAAAEPTLHWRLF
jgi:hypothetical protein